MRAKKKEQKRNFLPAFGAVLFFSLALLIAVIIFKGGEPMPQAQQKEYVSAQFVKLPAPDYEGMTVEKAIRERRSVRDYSSKSMTLDEVSQLVFAAQGETSPSLRAAPSAGALYPLELYVYAHRVENLSQGIYHYHPKQHALDLVERGDFSIELSGAALGQPSVADAAAVFIFTAIPARTEVKYGERTQQYILLETGHASENLLLEATSLGLGAVPIGAFNDTALNSILGIDGKNEKAHYINVVGKKE